MSNVNLKESQGTKHLIYEISDRGLIDELRFFLKKNNGAKFQTLHPEKIYTADSLHPGALKLSYLKREDKQRQKTRGSKKRKRTKTKIQFYFVTSIQTS